MFADDCIRRFADKDKDVEEEDEEEKDPIFIESAIEEFLGELAKKQALVPMATALDFVSLLSYSMLHR